VWYVYICEKRGQLYTGMTTDLAHRMRQHGAHLLHAENFPDKHLAAHREREIKGWCREKKLALIQEAKVSLP
jgi:putative endonuclease